MKKSELIAKLAAFTDAAEIVFEIDGEVEMPEPMFVTNKLNEAINRLSD